MLGQLKGLTFYVRRTLVLSRIQTSGSYGFKFESVEGMHLMYGVPKPFNVTCHGHRNIALTVEGCPDLARRLVPRFQISKRILRKIIKKSKNILHLILDFCNGLWNDDL